MIVAELEQLDAMVEASGHERNRLFNIMLNGRYSGKLHLGRRAVMGFALQWLQQWSGILAIVGWADTLFKLAGFDDDKSLWLSACVNAVGVFGTLAAASVIDRMGRVKSLMTSFAIQAVSLCAVAVLIMKGQEASSDDNHELATRLGKAAAAFVFIYMW